MSDSAKTTYRYITSAPDISEGRPIIEGTRILVKAIVGYYKMGLSVEEILEGLPQLTPAQVYEALSYYHDHKVDIEQDIEHSKVERLVERYGLEVMADGRIIANRNNDDS